MNLSSFSIEQFISDEETYLLRLSNVLKKFKAPQENSEFIKTVFEDSVKLLSNCQFLKPFQIFLFFHVKLKSL